MKRPSFRKAKHVPLIACLILLLGCNNNDYNDITDECLFPTFQDYACFEQPFGNDYDELVIEDSATFYAYMDSLGAFRFNESCDSTDLPRIDFDTYVLLRKYASGGGCEIDFERKVLQDVADEKIIYQIEVKTKGFCDMLGVSNNWVLIPRELFYRNVEFVVEE